MSDTTESLRRKITSAGDLQSVVRTMKAMAASSIGQYENAVRSLDDYYRTVQLGLIACFRQNELSDAVMKQEPNDTGTINVIVFGSDQGLVGQFNEVMAEFVVKTLKDMSGKVSIWTVGERIHSRLAETNLPLEESFTLPNSICAITQLVGQLLTALEVRREKGLVTQVYLFNNCPKSGSIFTPVSRRLLPLDNTWKHDLTASPWPTNNLPETLNNSEDTLLAFVSEYLFVSLFRACAESLASENASRLAAMQRAEKNIDELLEDLNRSFHRLRQSGIDEELFDVISGFEALTAT
ncbi:ATP synthase gamma chain [mine drainage metagenome]|uniref:ATP synthase gamma chain n=1 Tax=mine drainage metagenome TaxID=410659 RepID=A0A1J5SFA0_9ZZZZ